MPSALNSTQVTKMQFVRKHSIVEALYFEKFISIGEKQDKAENRQPWHFEVFNKAVTHETDDCYLVDVDHGTRMMTPHTILIKDAHGKVYIMPKDNFHNEYIPK